MRRAFYLSYDDTNCEYLTGEEIDEKLDAGIDVVSATFVTPYPPGFPVLVPGQVFSREILTVHSRPRHPGDPRLQTGIRLSRVHREGHRAMWRPAPSHVTSNGRAGMSEGDALSALT